MTVSLRKIALIAAVGCAVSFGSHEASAQDVGFNDVRAEAPIHQTVLARGSRHYGVPIRVGKTEIEAILDSGTLGLRVVPGVLSADDARSTNRPDRVNVGPGQIDGSVGLAKVAIGETSRPITMQLIAEGARYAELDLTNDPRPSSGYKALLGTSIRGFDNGIAQPLVALGARRWLVDLPRVDAPTGRLVLNPTSAETAGFASVPIQRQFGPTGSLHDPLTGCIVNGTTSERVCGVVLMNVQAPRGITVSSQAGVGTLWAPTTPLVLELAGADRRVHVSVPLTVNSGTGTDRTGVRFQRNPQGLPVVIATGSSLYEAFSILADVEHDTIGFKPRPVLTDGFTGTVTP